MSRVLGTEKVQEESGLRMNVAGSVENLPLDSAAATGAIRPAIHKPRPKHAVPSWVRYLRCLPSEIGAIFYHVLLKLLSLLGPRMAFQASLILGRIRHRLRGSRNVPLQREVSTSLRVTPEQAFECVARSNGLVLWEDVEFHFRRKANKKSVGKLIDIRGLENLQAALRKGKGALVCTGHVRGIFAFMVGLHLRGYKINAIRRSPKGHQGPIGRWFNRQITLVDRGCCNFLWMQQDNLRVAVQAAKALRRNEIVIVLIDARFPTEPVEARFLDRLLPLPSGHVILAQACGAPLLNFFVHSSDKLPRIAEIGTIHYPGGDVQASVQHCISELEAEILKTPADWMWHQERELWARSGDNQL